MKLSQLYFNMNNSKYYTRNEVSINNIINNSIKSEANWLLDFPTGISKQNPQSMQRFFLLTSRNATLFSGETCCGCGQVCGDGVAIYHFVKFGEFVATC